MAKAVHPRKHERKQRLGEEWRTLAKGVVLSGV